MLSYSYFLISIGEGFNFHSFSMSIIFPWAWNFNSGVCHPSQNYYWRNISLFCFHFEASHVSEDLSKNNWSKIMLRCTPLLGTIPKANEKRPKNWFWPFFMCHQSHRQFIFGKIIQQALFSILHSIPVTQKKW